ncbi:MAG: right-handed parallel beta-helix repeat-containing protein [Planctomycetota bacterium]|nr:right-handed parallel beta-helix repeat-containing protein [Planctomycetota bacterium]
MSTRLLASILLCSLLAVLCNAEDSEGDAKPSVNVHGFVTSGRTLHWDFTLHALGGAQSDQNAASGVLVLADVEDARRVERLPLREPVLAFAGGRASLRGATKLPDGFGEGAFATTIEWEAGGKSGREKLGVTLVKHHGMYLSFLPSDERYSAYPPEIAAWTPELKQAQREAGTKLVADLYEALKTGKKSFSIPKGDYRLTLPPHKGGGKPCYLNLQDLDGFTLKGNGATLWLDSGAANVLRFSKCRNVTVKDLSFDYDPLPFAQGRVVAIDEEQKRIRFTCDPGFEESIKAFENNKGLLRFHAFYPEIEKSRAIKRDWVAGHADNTPVEPLGNGLYESGLVVRYWPPAKSGLAVGDAISLTPRWGGAVLNLFACGGMKFQNVKIYAAGLDSIVDVYSGCVGGKGSVYEGLELRRRPNTRRLTCNNSAGLFTMQAGDGFTVRDSIFEGSMDDSIPIQSFNPLIVKSLSETEHVMANRSASVPLWIKAGATVSIYALGTLEPRGTAKIEKTEAYEEEGLAEKEKARNRFAWGPTRFVKITLSEKLRLEPLDMILWDDVPAAKNFRIENCFFHSGWARSLYVTGDGGVIRGNTFEKTCRINIGPSTAWMIGTFAKDILIEKNRLFDISASEASPLHGVPILVCPEGRIERPLNRNIVIRDNQIERSWYAGIAAQGVDGLKIERNRLLQVNQRRAEAPEGGLDINQPIATSACANVLQEDNVIESAGDAAARERPGPSAKVEAAWTEYLKSLEHGKGAYPPEILAWDEAEKERQREAGLKLRADLMAAIKAGQKEFVMEKGNYRFNSLWQNERKDGSSYLLFQHVEDFTLDGAGSTIWFEDSASSIELWKCRNVTLKNLVFDWDGLPFTQGKIVALHPDEGRVDVEIEEGFERVTPAFAKRNAEIPDVEPHINAMFFDPKTRNVKPGAWHCRAFAFWGNKIGERTYRVKVGGHYNRTLAQGFGVGVGDLVALCYRRGGGIAIRGSENVTIQDVTYYAVAGFTFFCDQGEGGLTFRRVRLLRRPGTSRLVCATADGIHACRMARGIQIEECLMDGVCDDFVNIHGFYSDVYARPAPDTLLMSGGTTHGLDLDQPGYELTLYEGETLKPHGTRKVKSMTMKEWAFDERQFIGLCGREKGKKFEAGQKLKLVEVVFEAPLDFDFKSPTLVAYEGNVCSGSTIRDNRFRNTWARGVLLSTTKALMEHNTLEQVAGHGVLMAPGIFWKEATMGRDIRIRENVFRDTMIYGTAHGVAYRNIGSINVSATAAWHESTEIVDNLFENCRVAALYAQGVRGLKILRNRLVNLNTEKSEAPEAGYGFVFSRVENLEFGGNAVESPGAGFKGEWLDVPPKP